MIIPAKKVWLAPWRGYLVVGCHFHDQDIMLDLDTGLQRCSLLARSRPRYENIMDKPLRPKLTMFIF
ncbi:MAG TPA: hypothetical protein VMH87_20660 [Pseudomonadales bacterium]|nr:hypothetical protein [Pseudomonadales bacterium]